MKRTVNRLPKNAVFDFTNIFGEKVYHTERRCYLVATSCNYGKKRTVITSQSRN